jgi:hypothetical protein
LLENDELKEDNDSDYWKQVLQGVQKGMAESSQIKQCSRLMNSDVK